MPYRRGYRRRSRRRPYRKSGSGTVSTVLGYAKKALRVANFVRGMVNVEKKFIDKIDQAPSLSNTAAIDLLSNVGQGDTDQLRNGNSIRAKSIYIKLALSNNASQTSNVMCRMILFIDMQNNGSVPTSTELLESANSVYSPINSNNGGRFRVLRDKVCVLTPQSDDKGKCYFEWYIPLSMHLHYIGTGSTQADVSRNSIYLYYVADVATNVPVLVYSSRIRFIDN